MGQACINIVTTITRLYRVKLLNTAAYMFKIRKTVIKDYIKTYINVDLNHILLRLILTAFYFSASLLCLVALKTLSRRITH